MATPGRTHFDLSESPMRWVRFLQSTHDEVTRMEQRPRCPDKRSKLRPAPPTLKRFRPARSVSSPISSCPSVLPFEEDVQIRTSPAEPFSKGSVPAQDREFVLKKCLLSLGCFNSLNRSISFRLEGVEKMLRSKIIASTGSKELVFKLKTTEEAQRAVRGFKAAPKSRASAGQASAPLRQFLASDMMDSMKPLFPSPKQRRASAAETMLKSIADEEDSTIAGLNVVRLRKDADAPKAVEMLSEDELVEYAHPIAERYLMLPRPRSRKARKRQTSAALDPLEDQQWGLGTVQLYRAQQLSGFNEAAEITVAVIDTGVDSSHPDLTDVVSEERTFTTGPLKDTMGHGTHVIGTIAALRNELGIVGVCQSRKIMSLKALGPYSGPGYYRAIRHATDQGAQVLNLSLGGGYDQTEELLIGRAIRQGMIVVAAMGNEFREGNPTSYPAAIEGVIAVGASTKADGRAGFSNTGRHIDLVAPGVDILSTVPTYPSQLTDKTNYDSWPGTSMAAPFVSAAAALLLAKQSEPDLARVRRVLVRGADKVPRQKGFSREFGYGRLNVKRSVKRIRAA